MTIRFEDDLSLEESIEAVDEKVEEMEKASDQKPVIDNRDVEELESILGTEVKKPSKLHKESFVFTDFNLESGSKSVMKEKVQEIEASGFKISGVRAGFENRLRIWFRPMEGDEDE